MRRAALGGVVLWAGCVTSALDPSAPVRPVAHAEALREVWRAPAEPIAYRARTGRFARVPLRRFGRRYRIPGKLPVVTPSGLVLTCAGGRVEARDAATGQLRWTYPFEGLVAPGESLQVAALDGWVLLYHAGAGHTVGVLLREESGEPVGEPFPLPADRILMAAHGRFYLHDAHTVEGWDPLARRMAWRWEWPPAFLPVRPWDLGSRILGVDVSGPHVVVEYFNGHRGYPLSATLDVVTGEVRWDTVARMMDVEEGQVVCLREREEMVDLRDAEGGSWRSEHPVRGYDGGGIWLERGAVVFTGVTRLFGPEAARVGPDGVRSVAGDVRIERSLVRYDPATRRVVWRVPLAAETVALERFGSTLVEAVGGWEPMPRLRDPWAVVPYATGLRGLSLREGTPLWAVELEGGASAWTVWGRYVVIVTRGGEVIVWRRE